MLRNKALEAAWLADFAMRKAQYSLTDPPVVHILAAALLEFAAEMMPRINEDADAMRAAAAELRKEK